MLEIDFPSSLRGRKVLIIAHAFPPTGGPGVQRPAKFAKYLPQFGWTPIIWSADQVDGLPRDESLVAELPAQIAIHSRPCGGMHAVRRTLRGFMTAQEGRGAAALAYHFAAAMDWRLAAWQQSRGFPDDCAGWARKSVRPLLNLIRSEGVDIVFSTFSPASSHLLALELKRRTGLPWVAEFRDLWIDDCRYRPAPSQRASHARLQLEILQNADAVIGVTPRQTAILASYVRSRRGRFTTITNGFDPEDFVGQSAPVQAGRRFVLAHVGRFDLARTRDELFCAFRSLSEQLGDQRERVLLRIVGHANAVARETIQAIGIPCEFIDYVPHADAIRFMRSADALLLTVPEGENGETIICGKLFEYLAARRPILVIGPQDGECERIVRQCRAGLTATFNADAILSAMQELYDAWRAGRPLCGCSQDALEPYSRVELTRRLSEVFEFVAGPGPASSPPARARATAGV